MKKYRNIEDVLKMSEVPAELWETENLMKQKPKFDKSDELIEIDSDKTNRFNEFIILKVRHHKKIGFIVYNTKKKWEDGHTHLKSNKMASTVIRNVTKRKKPKTDNIYLLESHKRLSTDSDYIKFIDSLIVAKKKQKQSYVNKKEGNK